MSASTAALPPLPLRHCYWVVPGLLLAGEHPNGPTRDKTKDRLKKLLAAGIECFVDLTKPTELLRYDTYLPFYVEYARKHSFILDVKIVFMTLRVLFFSKS